MKASISFRWLLATFILNCCACLLHVPQGFADDAPGVAWSKCYGGSNMDVLNDIAQDASGNYFMCGWTISNDGDVSGLHGAADVWVIKTDHAGNLIWQKILGGSNNEVAQALVITPDGGCIIAGFTDSNDGDVSGLHAPASGYEDVWLVKLDANGNINWQRCLGGSGNDGAEDVIATADGHYLLSARAHLADGDISTVKGEGDAWLVKFDIAGDVLWEKTYGGTKNDAGGPLTIHPAGGFSVCGSSTSKDGDVTKHHGSALFPDIWIFNIDENGNLLTQKSLGGGSEEYPSAIHAFPDGSLLVAGRTQSGNGDVHGNHGATDGWVVRLNIAGNIEWERCYGGTEVEHLNQMIPSGDGNFYFVSYAESKNGDVSASLGSNDFWIVKINGNGDILWDESYGGSDSDEYGDFTDPYEIGSVTFFHQRNHHVQAACCCRP